MILLVSLILGAWAGPRHAVVATGQTVEDLAGGDAALAAEIRALNGLGEGEQPEPGRVLELPGEEPSQDALLLALTGEATLRLPTGSRPVEAGATIPVGTALCTGPDAYATVRLAVEPGGTGHDDVTLLGGTCITVAAAWADADERSTLLDLESGSLRVRASETPGAVAVRTEAGLTAGTGGGYRVSTEPDAARTEAVEAPVSVFGAGVEVRLAAGQGSRVRKGEAPSPPVDLLRPGELLRPADGAPLRRPDFTWVGVDGALGYRVELSVAPDMGALVAVEEVTGNTWRPDTLFLPFRPAVGASLPDGAPAVWWRVAAFDRMGFLGIDSEPRAFRFPPGVGP